MLNITKTNDPVLPTYSICTDFFRRADHAVFTHVADVKVKNAEPEVLPTSFAVFSSSARIIPQLVAVAALPLPLL
jgi:hypothetical protein